MTFASKLCKINGEMKLEEDTLEKWAGRIAGLHMICMRRIASEYMGGQDCRKKKRTVH